MTRSRPRRWSRLRRARQRPMRKARADQDAAETDAVRVTYVPEIVKQQISQQVSARDQGRRHQGGDGAGAGRRLGRARRAARVDQGRAAVRRRARARRRRPVRQRQRARTPISTSMPSTTAAASAARAKRRCSTPPRIAIAWSGAFRSGLVAQLGNSFSVDMRLASGNVRSPVSTNQTLGNYGGRWTVNVDKAALLWNPINAGRDRELDLRFGRFANPFVTTSELIWDNDVTFEGLSATLCARPVRQRSGAHGARPVPDGRRLPAAGSRAEQRRQVAVRGAARRRVHVRLAVAPAAWRPRTTTTRTSPACATRSTARCSTSPRRASCRRATRCSTSATTRTPARTCSRSPASTRSRMRT